MEMYKPNEFAKLIGVSVRTLQRWDNEHKLDAFRTPTGRRYYTQEQYQDYVNNRLGGTTSMNVTVSIEQTESGKSLPLPKYMSTGAAGMDLYADVPTDEPMILEPGDHKLIPTGIKIALPDGFEAQIRGRSGMAAKYAIGIPNAPGTIDADYRGEVKVILINWGKEPFVINRGERIAQMVINKIEQAEWNVVTSLDATERGEGGFGHSGR